MNTTIDLDQAERATNSIVMNDDEVHRHTYQEQILQQRRKEDVRHIYLPMFPTIVVNPTNCLLLPNVPKNRLTLLEQLRRQHGGSTREAILLMSQYSYSNIFGLLEMEVEELTERLNIDKSIITFNARRLRSHCEVFLQLHEFYRRHYLRQPDVAVKEPFLNSKQMAQALEFYLQFDLNVFEMKICSFRGAQPPSTSKGLFRDDDDDDGNDESRYQLSPCHQMNCPLCSSSTLDPSTSFEDSILDFNSSSTHRFLNGYQTYLNAPANCTTSNIVYALTCVCGHYDYVESTSKNLVDVIVDHRRQTNRIIHETLTGSQAFRGILIEDIENENTMANGMRLYRHISRCSIALRHFLKANPRYGCFIPVNLEQAASDNAQHLPSSSSMFVDPSLGYIMATTNIDNPTVMFHIDHVPYPAVCYTYSYGQVMEQRAFFEDYIAISMHETLYNEVNPYSMAIIAVLPDPCSIVLRYIIETLFVIQAETKLNMICPIGGDAEKRYGLVYDKDWHIKIRPSSMESQT